MTIITSARLWMGNTCASIQPPDDGVLGENPHLNIANRNPSGLNNLIAFSFIRPHQMLEMEGEVDKVHAEESTERWVDGLCIEDVIPKNSPIKGRGENEVIMSPDPKSTAPKKPATKSASKTTGAKGTPVTKNASKKPATKSASKTTGAKRMPATKSASKKAGAKGMPATKNASKKAGGKRVAKEPVRKTRIRIEINQQYHSIDVVDGIVDVESFCTVLLSIPAVYLCQKMEELNQKFERARCLMHPECWVSVLSALVKMECLYTLYCFARFVDPSAPPRKCSIQHFQIINMAYFIEFMVRHGRWRLVSGSNPGRLGTKLIEAGFLELGLFFHRVMHSEEEFQNEIYYIVRAKPHWPHGYMMHLIRNKISMTWSSCADYIHHHWCFPISRDSHHHLTRSDLCRYNLKLVDKSVVCEIIHYFIDQTSFDFDEFSLNCIAHCHGFENNFLFIQRSRKSRIKNLDMRLLSSHAVICCITYHLVEVNNVLNIPNLPFHVLRDLLVYQCVDWTQLLWDQRKTVLDCRNKMWDECFALGLIHHMSRSSLIRLKEVFLDYAIKRGSLEVVRLVAHGLEDVSFAFENEYRFRILHLEAFQLILEKECQKYNKYDDHQSILTGAIGKWRKIYDDVYFGEGCVHPELKIILD